MTSGEEEKLLHFIRKSRPLEEIAVSLPSHLVEKHLFQGEERKRFTKKKIDQKKGRLQRGLSQGARTRAQNAQRREKKERKRNFLERLQNKGLTKGVPSKDTTFWRNRRGGRDKNLSDWGKKGKAHSGGERVSFSSR